MTDEDRRAGGLVHPSKLDTQQRAIVAVCWCDVVANDVPHWDYLPGSIEGDVAHWSQLPGACRDCG